MRTQIRLYIRFCTKYHTHVCEVTTRLHKCFLKGHHLNCQKMKFYIVFYLKGWTQIEGVSEQNCYENKFVLFGPSITQL
jgi:hypothetical protein